MSEMPTAEEVSGWAAGHAASAPHAPVQLPDVDLERLENPDAAPIEDPTA